jgi:hypothetical protein
MLRWVSSNLMQFDIHNLLCLFESCYGMASHQELLRQEHHKVVNDQTQENMGQKEGSYIRNYNE